MNGQQISSVGERFWVTVLKGLGEGDCWLWTGAIADDGHGRFFVKTGDRETSVRPQRYAYEEQAGVLLPAAVVLRHRCNIPICVRPEYLLPCTQRENMQAGSSMADFAGWSRALSNAARLGPLRSSSR